MTIADHDHDERERAERLEAFFRGETPQQHGRGLTIGISDADRRRRDEAWLDAELADLMDCVGADEIDELEIGSPDLPDTGNDTQEAITEAEEPLFERIYDAPVLTPYDKARQRLTDAEILRDVAAPGSDEYHEAMADMAAAKRDLKTAIERDADPVFRKRRAIDEHRKGPGREEYNASRRKVRDKPNAMTPKDVLDAMTPEERAQHNKDKNAEKQWRYGRRKAGWSAERIEAELPGWWARRKAKRPCA